MASSKRAHAIVRVCACKLMFIVSSPSLGLRARGKGYASLPLRFFVSKRTLYEESEQKKGFYSICLVDGGIIFLGMDIAKI